MTSISMCTLMRIGGRDISHRVSRSGYIIFIGKNPISWSSKKLTIALSTSSMFLYKEVANALSETFWGTNLLNEWRFTEHKLPKIYCDNLRATFLWKNILFHSRVKHFAVDFHFVCHHVNIKRVLVIHVHDVDQIDETLTKALPKLHLKRIYSRSGYWPLPNMRGNIVAAIVS